MSEWDWAQPGVKAESVDIEEVWNQCTILKRCADRVKVRYDGWSSTYDEEIPFAHNKLCKLGKHTIRRRCWVKHAGSVWPAVAFLRSGASKKGEEYLASEGLMLFLVSREKRTDYVFLEPNKCMSWSAYSSYKASKPAVQRNKEVGYDDEQAIRFRTGTLPSDAMLQFRPDPNRQQAKPAAQSQVRKIEDVDDDGEIFITDEVPPVDDQEILEISEKFSTPPNSLETKQAQNNSGAQGNATTSQQSGRTKKRQHETSSADASSQDISPKKERLAATEVDPVEVTSSSLNLDSFDANIQQQYQQEVEPIDASKVQVERPLFVAQDSNLAQRQLPASERLAKIARMIEETQTIEHPSATIENRAFPQQVLTGADGQTAISNAAADHYRADQTRRSMGSTVLPNDFSMRAAVSNQFQIV